MSDNPGRVLKPNWAVTNDIEFDDPEEAKRFGIGKTIFECMLDGTWPATPEQLAQAREFVARKELQSEKPT